MFAITSVTSWQPDTSEQVRAGSINVRIAELITGVGLELLMSSIAFDRSTFKFMAETLGFEVRDADNQLYAGDKLVACHICGVPINEANVGGIFKHKQGSHSVKVIGSRRRVRTAVSCNTGYCLVKTRA